MWALKSVMVLGYIVATMCAGLWLVVPASTPLGFIVLFALIAVLTWPRITAAMPTDRSSRLLLAVQCAMCAAVLGTIAVALSGRIPPTDPGINLEFPLRNGTYYIANGGSRRIVNAHVALIHKPGAASFRGAGYALDIVKLDDDGWRARGIAPRHPDQYVIFGDNVYAPCAGIVARSEDGLPDLEPPTVDRSHLPGNFVLLECGDAHVLLAHLRQESVKVHPGDVVTTRTLLGEVGNSGNSNEPHLHIHAQQLGVLWAPFDAEPRSMWFDGRFLVRNDRVFKGNEASKDIDD